MRSSPLSRGARTAFLLVLGAAGPGFAVVRGRVVEGPELAEWRSTVLFTSSSGAICTATVVGPNVILTSAHCLGSGGSRPGFGKIDGVVHPLSCDVHPEYEPAGVADFALCKATSPLTGASIERVSTDPGSTAAGLTVTIAGYGCRLPDGVDRNLGQLAVGDAVVEEVEAGPSSQARVGGAALCFGDGGGGAFVNAGAKGAPRLLVGVGARGDVRQVSWIALTASSAFTRWATKWTAEQQVEICGIAGESGCSFTGDVGLPPVVAATAAARNAVETLTLPSPPPVGPEVAGVPLSRTVRVDARALERLEDIVERVCGNAGRGYYDQLRAFSGIPPELKAGDALLADQEIDLPPCPPVDESAGFVERVVQPEDTVWGYYLQVLREDPNAGWKDFQAPAGVHGAARGLYFRDAFQALNPKVNVESLTEDHRVRVPSRPPSAVESLPVAAASPRAGEPIFAVDEDADSKCTPYEGRLGHPYDLPGLLDVLARNKTRRRSTAPRERALVLVADSGLYGVKQGVFSESVLVNTDQQESWPNYAASVMPPAGGPKPMHGTQVASLLLGGPIFARVMAATEQRIRLIIERLYERRAQGAEEWYSLKENAYSAIGAAIRMYSPQIVNLSFKTTSEIDTIRSDLGLEGKTLWVAAAGNDDGALGQAFNHNYYPAVYNDAPNLVVVAAIDAAADGALKLARFSNHGTPYVDIGAQGCKVPVLSYRVEQGDWVTSQASGTSVAAPLVSFTAALVHSEKNPGVTPIGLKRRLLASADLRPELARHIADGRLLNVVKAVAVFDDVVELKESGRLILGDLQFSNASGVLRENHSIEFVCGGTPTPIKVADLFKLVPEFPLARGGTVAKIYSRAPPGSAHPFVSYECDLPMDLKVGVKDPETGIVFGPTPLNAVADVVRKYAR
jgi:hypothetical protein